MNAFPISIASGHRSGECVLKTPFEAESVKYSRGVRIKPFCPFTQKHGFSAKGDVTVIGLITHLLRVGSPPAILRRVVTVIINSVDTVLRGWSFTHVGIKVSKIIPPVADGNSFPTVRWILLIIPIITSASHVSPMVIFRCVSKSVSGIEMRCMVHNESITHGGLV